MSARAVDALRTAPGSPRYRCDPCGFSSWVVVNGREGELGMGDRLSFALAPCPRCGRRDRGSVLRLFAIAALVGAALVGGGVLAIADEAPWGQSLGSIAFVCAIAFSALTARRYLGARRAVRFLPY